ncbi:MFS transporter [Actinosynnema sp. NPDC020468]|uniref:MFS transporter n=1 Tax=Actinosynnema sp. NPDC020468 TaxID=3154488 RepID=UPI0033F33C3C
MRLVALLTSAMGFSMLPLFLLGALAPFLVADLAVARPLLGVLVTAGFGVAAVLSLIVGSVVDAVGARRATVALFAVSAVALGVFAVAGGYGALVGAVALGGVPQALANPATNRVIAAHVAPARRPGAVGVKQSGVQLGAFAAGLPLAWVAQAVDWRVAVGCAAVLAGVAAVAALGLPADPEPVRRTVVRVAWTAEPTVRRLLAFSVPLGAGIAAVNTYVALFAGQDLGFPPRSAAALVAGLGVTGIVGRVLWTRVGTPRVLLAPLAAGAVLAALSLAFAGVLGGGFAWVGVLAVGAFAVSANAVSMSLVLATATPGHTGRDSALVSAGFFAGFALGPPVVGVLVDAAGYRAGWLLVAALFAGAGAVVLRWRR